MLKSNIYIFSIISLMILFIRGSLSFKQTNLNNQYSNNDTLTFKKDSTLKLFFDFDEVSYFYNNYDATSEENKYDRYPSKHKVDKFKILTLFSYHPTNISDIGFIDYLSKNGFVENKLDSTLFDQLNDIFVEKPANSHISNSCSPTFRDVLIFRKYNKVIGIVKICFQCNEAYFVGANHNTLHFGVFGEYEKLKLLLRSNFKVIEKNKIPHEIKIKY